MYLKIAGACLILFSSSAMGMGYGKRLKEHLQELRYIKQICQYISGQLQYTKEPLPELFLELSGRVKEPYRMLFYNAHRIFEKKGSVSFPEWFRKEADVLLGTYRKEKGMTEEEWELFLSLGEQSGYLDIRMQTGAVLSCIERWELYIEKAEKEIGPKQRIGNCLGILSGVFLIVLFF